MSSNVDFSNLKNFADLVKPAAASAKGKALDLDLTLIDEDPNNPRQDFDQAELQELADSIAARGVKTPISVRPHPSNPDRYIINHGARRVRASKLAGKSTVPAFIDEDHNDVDMLVENIQRADLTPREVVHKIGQLLAKGMKQSDIVKETGKSKVWVSKHAALTDLPDPLAELLASGRCRDASTLYEALQCYKAAPDAVAAFLDQAGDRQIVQADIEALRASIKRGGQTADAAPADGTPPSPITAAAAQAGLGTSPSPITNGEASPTPLAQEHAGSSAEPEDEDDDDGADEPRQQSVKPTANADPLKVRKPLVQVRIGRREAVLLVAKRAEYGLAWVQYEDGTEDQIDVGKVKLVAVVDGAAK